jgi:hypothetical protein
VWSTTRTFDQADVALMKHSVRLYPRIGNQSIVSRHALVLHTPDGIWGALALTDEEFEVDQYLAGLDAPIRNLYRGWGAPVFADY